MRHTVKPNRNAVREILTQALRLLPVHATVDAGAKRRRICIFGVEILMNRQTCELQVNPVTLAGEDERLAFQEPFCIANIRRPFSLSEVEKIVERAVGVVLAEQDDYRSRLTTTERGELLQGMRDMIDLKQINREVVAALELEDDVLAIAELIPGIESGYVSGHLYCKIWRNMDSLQELLRHAPNLLPLAYACIVNDRLWGGSDILLQIKEALRRGGLSKKAWSELIRLPRSTIDRLIPLLADEMQFFSLFVAAHAAYRAAEDYGPPGFNQQLALKEAGNLHVIPVAVVRLMASQAWLNTGTGGMENFLIEGVAAVSDWLREENPSLDHISKLNWQELLDRARIYREEIFGQSEINESRSFSWDSVLSEHEDGGYLFVPLTSSESLREEGEKMSHCVAHYDFDCESGKSRIFSVRSVNAGVRLATAELHVDDLKIKKKWLVGQIKGYENAAVSKELAMVIDGLANRYTEKSNG